MRNKFIGIFALVLLSAFLFVLIRIALLPLDAGDAYPPYSTLRADPRGAMALFKSLAALPELKVEQNFQPLHKLKGSTGAVFLLGESAPGTSSWSEGQLKTFESIVNDGGRLVIAFLPAPPQSNTREPRSHQEDRVPPISKRWHVTAERYIGSEKQLDETGSMPRDTWAYFDMDDASGWRVLDRNDVEDPILIEHDFGKGQIVLLAESYPLSNEGLRAERDVALISSLAGPSTHIVFDESHLGVSNTGSVGTLIRRYRLTGAFAVMLLLGCLFLWKNSTSLMPQAADSRTLSAIGADSQSGLVNLLKRSVPAAQLAAACWNRWKETRGLGRPVTQQRVDRAELLLSTAPAAVAPAKIYQEIQNILTEKT